MDKINIGGGKFKDMGAYLRGDVLSPLWQFKYGFGEFVSVAHSKCGRATMLTIVGTKCRDHYAI